MGSGASASTFNEEECRVVCGEMFDPAKFKELKDSRGRVTLKQLNDQKLATQGEGQSQTYAYGKHRTDDKFGIQIMNTDTRRQGSHSKKYGVRPKSSHWARCAIS